MPWLLNEDAAMKRKLSGLTVTGSAVEGPIPVLARFPVPQDEFTDFTYPSILITQASVWRDPERESRGLIHITSLPEGFDAEEGDFFAETPVPHRIDYQVELLTRLNQHRTELMAALAGFHFLPERFGYLEIPEDNSIRHLDVLGGPETSSSRDSNNKRLFTAVYRIRVSSELFTLGDPVTFPVVETVDVDLHGGYVPGQPG